MASINIYCPSTTLRLPVSFKTFKFFNGLCHENLFSANGCASQSVIRLTGRPCFSKKADKFDANNALPGVCPDSIVFGKLAANAAPTSSGFLIDSVKVGLDRPMEGFSSISEAIEDIRQGKIVVVVDDEDRENEGDLIMAASKVTPEAMAFFVKHGTGIVCVSMKGQDLERLKLPLMVTHEDNDDRLCTAFTVSVDAKHGTTTGVSARDRATTILALASKDSKPEDFNRPGHIFPLKYREGGVLKRAGHTEASVDLAMLAGLEPVAVICEIVDDDGSMARLPKLLQFAQTENLKVISIADLISPKSDDGRRRRWTMRTKEQSRRMMTKEVDNFYNPKSDDGRWTTKEMDNDDEEEIDEKTVAKDDDEGNGQFLQP